MNTFVFNHDLRQNFYYANRASYLMMAFIKT
jgi:hypothetical protein